jgi:holo-[acyl-carrier protein] synthase
VIVGVGIDVVTVERFGRALDRAAGLAPKLFTPDELDGPGTGQAEVAGQAGQAGPADGAADRVQARSLAARFAAKEALAKALGAPGNLRWHDVAVLTEPTGRPRFEVGGSVAQRCAELGVAVLHLSLSHETDVATAIVIAEG